MARPRNDDILNRDLQTMVRLTRSVRQELEATALAEQRSISSLINKILVAWLVNRAALEDSDVRC
jgi:hypothetical protein